MSTNCTGLIGLIFGHKYSSRFSYGEPLLASVKGCPPIVGLKMVEASKSKTYVCDICERCGAVINPPKLESKP